MLTIQKIIRNSFLSLGFIPGFFLAQELLVQKTNYGFNLGLNLAFGTHFQRVGMNLNFFYVNNFFQANTEVRAYFNFKNLGPKVKSSELVLSQALLYAYGSGTHFFNPFLGSISNQTNYSNSIAYAFNVYLNKIKTRQVTGTVAFQFNTISVIAEDDLFAKPALDRFRTGAFLIQYQHENILQAAINCSMWTGKMGRKKTIDNEHFYAGCYMDTNDAVYHKYSHGLLSAQIKYHLAYAQTAQLNVGIDAEQVRNAIQNHLFHDMRFIPKKINKTKNCHVPMLDQNGGQYLYKQGQEIRKSRLYMNVFSNAGNFY